MSQGEAAEGEASAPEAPRKSRRRGLLLIPVILVLAGAATAFWLASRGRASTDDAQIEGGLVPISPRVSGYVASIEVADNQRVEAGQLLVQLDRRDLDARLRRAQADLAAQRAQQEAAAGQTSLVERTAPAGELQAAAGVAAATAAVATSESQVASAEAQARSAEAAVETARSAVASAKSGVDAATAQVRASEAALQAARAEATAAQAQANKAASDAARFRELYAAKATSKQQLDAMEAADISAQSALQAARDRIANASAAVEQAQALRKRAQAAVGQAQARLASAVATAAQARAGVTAAETALDQARARLEESRAARSAAQTAPQQVSVSKAQSAAARARIEQAAADLANAELQLGYTGIAAPVAGVVSKKSVQLGQFVQPGQLLMALVPLEDVWVVANFKETQIGRMRPGQRAVIRVDSYPGRRFRGKLHSIGAATGAKFSLLPPENATGNFVKVVQRIPVKIVFDQAIPDDIVLRPGENVRATVYLSRRRG